MVRRRPFDLVLTGRAGQADDISPKNGENTGFLHFLKQPVDGFRPNNRGDFQNMLSPDKMFPSNGLMMVLCRNLRLGYRPSNGMVFVL